MYPQLMSEVAAAHGDDLRRVARRERVIIAARRASRAAEHSAARAAAHRARKPR